jgi:hypothetical protein
MKSASQFDKLCVIQRLKDGAVHPGQIDLVFRFHAQSESKTALLASPISLEAP